MLCCRYPLATLSQVEQLIKIAASAQEMKSWESMERWCLGQVTIALFSLCLQPLLTEESRSPWEGVRRIRQVGLKDCSKCFVYFSSFFLFYGFMYLSSCIYRFMHLSSSIYAFYVFTFFIWLIYVLIYSFFLFAELHNRSMEMQFPYDLQVTRRENEGFGFVIISSVTKSGSTIGMLCVKRIGGHSVGVVYEYIYLWLYRSYI